MFRAAIGVMVHDEAGNLPGLLARLAAEQVPGMRIDPIVVVSSGSTDGSEEIVAQMATEDARITLIAEPERRGKAQAINRFLAVLPEDVDHCVLVSGDVLPEIGALGELLAPLSQDDVGMTGARVIPTNGANGMASKVVHALWAMHHTVASRRPKLGEMVAFRAGLGPLDARTPVDEATLEAQVIQGGQRLAYIPQARVYNRGPETLSELICQRQRIWRGHRWLRLRTGYTVATYRWRDLVGPTLLHLTRHPTSAPTLALAAAIEVWSRLSGSLSAQPLPTVWAVLPSAKAPIQHS